MSPAFTWYSLASWFRELGVDPEPLDEAADHPFLEKRRDVPPLRRQRMGTRHEYPRRRRHRFRSQRNTFSLGGSGADVRAIAVVDESGLVDPGFGLVDGWQECTEPTRHWADALCDRAVACGALQQDDVVFAQGVWWDPDGRRGARRVRSRWPARSAEPLISEPVAPHATMVPIGKSGRSRRWARYRAPWIARSGTRSDRRPKSNTGIATDGPRLEPFRALNGLPLRDYARP